MGKKLEALCQLADANAALNGSGFMRPAGLKLNSDDIMRLASEIRELQRDAVPPPPRDGDWIEWHGGACPVDGEAWLNVRYRDGSAQDRCPADWLRWDHSSPDDKPRYEYDIVAYRLMGAAT